MSDELEQLREQVTALTELVEQMATAGEQEQEATVEAIGRLETAVGGLLEVPTEATETDEAPKPVAWVDYASAEDWVRLCDWVDWLMGAYDLDDARQVWSCWPAHLGVAEELAALWSAWLEAASRAREADGDALAFWHDRYLIPFLMRVQRVYNIGLCREGHTSMSLAAPTNRTLIDVRSAAITNDQDSDEQDSDDQDSAEQDDAKQDSAVAEELALTVGASS